MSEHGFDATLLTGYLDGELTQADAQRVRLHLEECCECRAELDEMRALADAMRTTPYVVPVDLQWDEAPRSAPSRVLRATGFAWFVVGVVGVIASVIWGLVADGDSDTIGLLVPIAFVAGALFVIASVLLDRVAIRGSDPYRKVRR